MLFCGDVRSDALNLCEYVDAFYETLEMGSADIVVEKISSVVSGMVQDCPYPLGIEAASPFKKAASFTCNMVAERPLLTPIPSFGELATHQNAIVAFALSIDMLEGAVIHCPSRGDIVLSTRITVSTHFLKDAINALSFAIPSNHFQLVSLLYEALSYEANPHASYPKVF